MAGVNKVIIVGNLGADPDMRTMPNGEAVANISVATSETWNDKNTGERREITEWHRIIFFRRNAEIVGQYLRKGSKIYVEGRLRTRKWQDQNGQDRYTTEIYGDVIQMLDSRNSGMDQGQGWANQNQSGYNQSNYNQNNNYGANNYNQGSYNEYSQTNTGATTKPQATQKPVQPDPPMDLNDDIPF